MRRKREQNNETMIEFMKEKMMFPWAMAFSSLRNFLARATMRKSRQRRKKTSSEYMIRVFQMTAVLDPMLAKMISSGSGALVMTTFDLSPEISSLML